MGGLSPRGWQCRGQHTLFTASEGVSGTLNRSLDGGFETLVFNSCFARGQSSARSTDRADEIRQHGVVANVVFVIENVPALLQRLVLIPLP